MDSYVFFNNQILKNGSFFKYKNINMAEINNIENNQNQIQVVRKVFNLDTLSYDIDTDYGESMSYTIGNTQESDTYQNGIIPITSVQRGHVLLTVDDIEYQFYKSTANDLWEKYQIQDNETVHQNTTSNEDDLTGTFNLLKRIKNLESRLETLEGGE